MGQENHTETNEALPPSRVWVFVLSATTWAMGIKRRRHSTLREYFHTPGASKFVTKAQGGLEMLQFEEREGHRGSFEPQTAPQPIGKHHGNESEGHGLWQTIPKLAR